MVVRSKSKEELWRSRLRRFQSSGMSVTRFCRERKGVGSVVLPVAQAAGA